MSQSFQPDNYEFLRKYIYKNVGIVLGSDKQYLLDCRLIPIAQQRGLQTLNELCELLRTTSDPSLGAQVAEAMTTNETYFFRDPAHYEAIRQYLLPRLRVERRDTRRLRFWSAAASTGQEAFSLAMALLEDGFQDWNVHILGTDYSNQVLERARRGTFPQLEVNRGLPAPLLVKYFRRAGLDWQLSEGPRNMVHFEALDLRKSMRSLGPFDLVFCRNVLIYFDGETKRQILKELHGTLYRGGWLLLGGSETAFGIDEWFDRQAIGRTVVYVAK
jgi:chemotaxis protein methyltransferase CheR